MSIDYTALADFLDARYDEEWSYAGRHWSGCKAPKGGSCSCAGRLGEQNRRFIADHEAKRAIVSAWRDKEATAVADAALRRPKLILGWDGGELNALEWVMQQLAAAHADHPDHDPAWKP